MIITASLRQALSRLHESYRMAALRLDVDVWKINADQSPDGLRALKVLGVPTTIGFAEGQEILRTGNIQHFDRCVH